MIQVIRHSRGGRHGDSDSLACKHRHRTVRAARACAKRAAIGVCSSGADKTVVIYVDGHAAEQFVEADLPLTVSGSTATWSSNVKLVLPSEPEWRAVSIAWYVHPVAS